MIEDFLLGLFIGLIALPTFLGFLQLRKTLKRILTETPKKENKKK